MSNLIKIIKNNRYRILLFLIFCLSTFLRLYKLNSLPFDFHEDEVLSGYVGRFILLHGKDIYGHSWPLLYFNKFGDYYIVFPMYLAGLSTFLFGINEFAVRFPTALIGALAVIPCYFIGSLVFNNKKVGLLSAFFLAITPWHIDLSRTAAEGVIGTTVFLTGISLLLFSLSKNKIVHFILSQILFLLGYFIYHPFRIYAPALSLAVLIIYYPIIVKQKKLFLYIFSTVFFSGLTFYILLTPWGSGRLLQTSIFNEISGVRLRYQELRFQEKQGDLLQARIFHNKVIGYGREFLNQYLSYFSPVVLFIKGGNSPRFAIPEQGLLYISFLLLIMAALIPMKLSRNPDKRHIYLLLFLLLLAPFPAGFTVIDSPNIHRTVFMVIPLVIIASYGLIKIKGLKIGNYFMIAILLMVLMEFFYFWHQYSVHSDIFTSLNRNDGEKQTALYVFNNRKKYNKILLPAQGTMSIYYLFYSNDFKKDYISQFKLDARLNSVGNIEFIDNGCTTNVNELTKYTHSLFVNMSNCKAPDNFKLIKQIQGVNSLIPYKLYTY